MFEETFPSVVSSTMNSCFSPAVLFLLLNLMIASIAISSKLSGSSNHEASEQNHQPQQQEQHGEEERNLSNPHFSEPPREPLSMTPTALGRFKPSDFHSSITQQDRESAKPDQDRETELEQETEETNEQFLEEIYWNIKANDAHEERHELEAPPRTRRSSCSMKSDSGQYQRGEGSRGGGGGGGGDEREDGAEVDRRRLVTAVESREEGEVDAKADAFINRFKQQLRLQRLESLARHRKMIGLS